MTYTEAAWSLPLPRHPILHPWTQALRHHSLLLLLQSSDVGARLHQQHQTCSLLSGHQMPLDDHIDDCCVLVGHGGLADWVGSLLVESENTVFRIRFWQWFVEQRDWLTWSSNPSWKPCHNWKRGSRWNKLCMSCLNCGMISKTQSVTRATAVIFLYLCNSLWAVYWNDGCFAVEINWNLYSDHRGCHTMIDGHTEHHRGTQ